MKRSIVTTVIWLCFVFLFGIAQQAATNKPHQNKPSPTTQNLSQPISRLAGEWQVTYIVVGGGVLSFGNCGQTKIDVSPGSSIGLSLDSLPCPHESVKTWRFQLKRAGSTDKYLLTIKGGFGPDVEDLTVNYTQDVGWQAKLPNDNRGITMEAVVKSMKDDGWQISVSSPEDTRVDAIPKPEMKVYLRPAKK